MCPSFFKLGGNEISSDILYVYVYTKSKKTIPTCLCAAAQARGVRPVLSTVLTSVPTKHEENTD